MLVLIIINAILCVIMSVFFTYYKFKRTSELYAWRIALGRIYVITRSTTSKWIFYNVYAQDLISVVVGMVGWPLSKEAIDCDPGYEMFYLMTLIYQTIAWIRILFTVLHFRYGQ